MFRSASLTTISLFSFALVGLTIAQVDAQQVQQRLPPGITSQQALQMAQQDPALGERLRQQLLQSGLTPDQVRARLREAGYPSGMLDSFLGADSITPPDPTMEMIQVISSLGLAEFDMQDSLLFAGDTIALRLLEDSLRLDSILRVDSIAELKQELKLFGLDVFRQPTTQFQPIVAGPVDDKYILAPGDEITLILTGDVETAFQLPVTTSGLIVIPRVGQISTNGLTLGQLRDVLYSRLEPRFSGISRGPNPRTRFEVMVSNVRVNSIRVIGEVSRPGTYRIAATGSVLSAIYEAGGLRERANFRAVQVRRGDSLVAEIDLYDYLLRGVAPADVHLATGDAIFVPIMGARVTIAGEVKRPGIYEMKNGEGLLDLVHHAGGLTAEASAENVTIERILPPEQRLESGRARTAVTANLSELMREEAPAVPVFDGDSVTVYSIGARRAEAVSIEGAVYQPGSYRLDRDMRLWDLIEAAGGLLPEAYRGRTQVVRMRPDSTTWMFGVPLPGDGSPRSDRDNPLLRELDEVRVFMGTEFLARRYIVVSGAVRNPDTVAFSDSMTLRDAILLAGGLREDASLLRADIGRRRPPDQSGDSLALALTVPLDSSYVLDRTDYVSRPVGANEEGNDGNGLRVRPEVLLHPFDQVMIREQPGLQPQRTIVLSGEVQYPGLYSLVSKDERLLDVIERAGGLTNQAYPMGMRFFRKESDVGRIGVDLSAAIQNRGHPDNLILAAGDSIHIPPFIPTVRVEGSVNSPTSVAYVPGRGLSFYIDAAGGYHRMADKGGTFVQQPSGRIEKGKRPEPGAVVFVPERSVGDRGTSVLQVIGALSPLIASLTTVLIVALTTR